MRRNRIFGILVSVVLMNIVLWGCSNKNIETVSETTSTDGVESKENSDIYIDVEINKNEGKPTFRFKSNLPDETDLMLSVKDGNGYFAQDKVSLSNGSAESNSFSNLGEPLVGNYTLEICTPFALMMPESVRAIIGENGENLTGDLVDSSEDGEKRIMASYDFTIE